MTLPRGHRLFAALAVMAVSLPAALGEEAEGPEPSVAVLFPWFAECLGVIIFFLLARYLSALPYTAVMFIIGTAMGIGAVRLGNTDYLTESILVWDSIDSEVLLLVFLPGSIFSDAFGLNVHLLQVSLWQCLNFAFPMVLSNTCLVALIAFFVFPFNWSWNLSMTFGAILSATDPVAVASLMNEVGAPPRLKMHISGESLMNDGSAMVFYDIWSQMFLTELGVAGVGKIYSVGDGFALFFRMSLGGAAIGLVAGGALVLFFYLLNRRLNPEENVVQVAATITMAYLTYYVADVVCGTSGVIATMTCGIICRAFGAGMINDQELMENFWSLVEQLINTALFTLGGVVWGTIIANPEGEAKFDGKDWGYLFLLYVMLHVFRFFLVFANYPITANIGLGTNWQESVFSSYGGLRGAVGISLAIAIDNLVRDATTDPVYREMTRTLFGMIGGVAFLTLVINGTTAGPVLRALGLVDIPEVRKKITDRYERRFRITMLDEFVSLLTDPRFGKLDFGTVKTYVFFLEDVTAAELKDAVYKHKGDTPDDKYVAPNLTGTIPYLKKGSRTDPEDPENDVSWAQDIMKHAALKESSAPGDDVMGMSISNIGALQESDGSSPEVKELRLIFVEVLKYAYEKEIALGELDAREDFVAYVLEEGLEFAGENANRGKPLNDWETSEVVRQPWKEPVGRWTNWVKRKFKCCKKKDSEADHLVPVTKTYESQRNDIHRALAFIKAHKVAEGRFMAEFCGDMDQLSSAEKLVILESRAEAAKAREVLNGMDDADKDMITTRLACQILLNKAAAYLEELATSGLLKAQEATPHVEDVEKALKKLRACTEHKHTGQTQHPNQREEGKDAGNVDKPLKEQAATESQKEPSLSNEGEHEA